jgi:hypothetical protein
MSVYVGIDVHRKRSQVAVVTEERGHRTLTITRTGGKVVTVPLALRTARAIDLAIGERTEGRVFLAADGRRLDGTEPGGSSARLPAAPGSASWSHRKTLRHAFITAAQVSGVASAATFRLRREAGAVRAADSVLPLPQPIVDGLGIGVRPAGVVNHGDRTEPGDRSPARPLGPP